MKIEKLHEKWKEATRFHSSLSMIVGNKYYQKIIDKGDEAVEYILKDFSNNLEDPDLWFPALKEITNADPVHARSIGKPVEMAKDWLIWGVKNDKIDPEDL